MKNLIAFFTAGPLAAFWAIERFIGLAGMPDDLKKFASVVGMIPDWVMSAAVGILLTHLWHVAWQNGWFGRCREKTAAFFRKLLGATTTVKLTQEEYDNLEDYDEGTFYIIVDRK